jgi:alpha-D-ribose 1-methylphosphonate 5-triphosphate synthase subunit PhnH
MKYKLTYSMLDVMMSSPDRPMKDSSRVHQLTRMWGGLAALETAENPTQADWIAVSDAVNMMETLVEMGFAKDEDNLIPEAVLVLKATAERYKHGQQLRLTGAGIQLLRGILEDYAYLTEHLDERTMVHAHRKTEMRIQDIILGRGKPEDVRVTA